MAGEAQADGGTWGFLLIPDSDDDTVGVYDPYDGTYLGDIINNSLGYLYTPLNAIQGPDGNIYLSDQVADAVYVYDTNGTFLYTYANASDGLDNIRGIDFYGSHLFITSGANYVAEFSGVHTRLADFIADGSGPFDIHFLWDGRALLSDAAGSSDNVRLYYANGTLQQELFKIDFPEQLQVDTRPPGDYLVGSFLDARAVDFALDGTIYQNTSLDRCRGAYRLGNGNLLLTNLSGVFEVENGTGMIIDTEKTGSARYIEYVDFSRGSDFSQGFVYIDANDNGSFDDGEWNGTVIADAIENASTSDTIYVWEGTYYETNILVNKTLTIIGNTSVDALNGVVSHNTNINYVDKGFIVEADYVNITGFNISTIAPPAFCGGVLVNHSSHCNISGNFIQGDADGIMLNHSDDNTIYNNIIRDQFMYGIWLVNASNNIIEANLVIENNIGIYYEPDMDNGIVFGSWNDIVGNNISDNTGWGIHMIGTDNETIMNNWFYGNGVPDFDGGGGAVSLLDVENSAIAENEMYGNFEGVALMDCYNVSVEDNIIIGLSIPSGPFNGDTYSVYVDTGEGWAFCRDLHVTQHYQTARVELPPSTGDTYRIRIEQHGGIAAHIDYVTLADGVAHPPDQAFVLGAGTNVIHKLRARDNDVADAGGKTIELTWYERFDQPVLVMVANEEQYAEREIPILTPPVMIPGMMESYTLLNNGPIEVDGMPDMLGEADLSALWMPLSGHPWGTTYVWLRCDGEYLYGAMDITADNTWDDTGWASLYVAVGNEVREFRVDAFDQTYGTRAFIYTDAVTWQHVFYEFQIPLVDIDASIGDTVRIGYGSYGTVTPTEEGSNGIRINGIRTNNTVRGNVLEEHSYGILLQGVDNETVEDNILYNNSYGIRLEMCRDVNVTGNEIDNDLMWGQHGIYVGDFGRKFVVIIPGVRSYNNVSHNTISNCSHGIHLQYTDNETVYDNTVSNCTYYGIYMERTNDSLVWDNILTANGFAMNVLYPPSGIMLYDCYNVTVLSNEVNGSSISMNAGIAIIGGPRGEPLCENTIEQNTIWHCYEAIVLDNTDRETLEGNTMYDNLAYGIYMLNSPYNVIANCTISSSGCYDFWSDELSHHNTITNLTVASYPTAVSLTYGDGIAVKGVESPYAWPAAWTDIGKFVDVTNVTESSWINLSIHYTDGDVWGTDESTLGLYHYNTTSTSWELVDAVLNESGNYFQANLSSFSQYGIFTDTVDVSMYLRTPWNLITVPVQHSWTSRTLGENISGCKVVTRWDVDQQMYIDYIMGIDSPGNPAFAILDGVGYFVGVTHDSWFHMSGPFIESISVTLQPGFNLVGWANVENTTAESLGDNITRCQFVTKWDEIRPQEFYTHVVGSILNDFTVSTGRGVFVYLTGTTNVTWNGGR